MTRIAPLTLTSTRIVRGGGAILEAIEDRMIDVEREFVEEAALFLRRPDLADDYARDPAGTVERLRTALDARARGPMTAARREFMERYGDFVRLQMERIDGVGRSAVKAGARGAVEAPPFGASGAAEIARRRYRRVDEVLERVRMTGREDVVRRLTSAMADVAEGSLSVDKAIRTCMEELAEKGVTGHVYPSGRSISLSPYVRREVMTNMMNVTNELAFERAKDWGTRLIQVSAHAGARPKCFPWQGGVYVVEGGTHGRFKPLSETSYGDPGGLFGINCRHFSWPFFEGLNDEYTAEQRDPARLLEGPSNDEIYKATQVQRRNERQIRAWKRIRAEAEATGADASWAGARVKAWQSRQRAFLARCQAANIDLRRDYLREKA